MDIGQVVQNVIKQRTPLPCNATAGHSTYKHALYAQCSWTEQWWPHLMWLQTHGSQISNIYTT